MEKLTLNFERGLNELYDQIRTSNFEFQFQSSKFELPKLLNLLFLSQNKYWGWSSTLGIVLEMILEFYNLIPYYSFTK